MQSERMPRYLWVSREERCVAHLPARISDLTASLADCARYVVSICFGVLVEGHCRMQRARVCGDLPFKLMTSLMVQAEDAKSGYALWYLPSYEKKEYCGLWR